MKANRILCGSIVAAGIAAGLAVGPVFGATTPPAKGVYSSLDLVDSASGSDCVQSKGELFGGHLNWPGADKTGAVWRYQINTAATGPLVEKVTYPTTPKASATHWSGTENYDFEPSGKTASATFEATLIYIDSVSFVMTRTIHYGNCTEEIASSFVAE